MFGVLRVQIGNRYFSDFPTSRCAELIALLALAKCEPVPRSTVIASLWPESAIEECANRLSVTLSLLRKTLEAGFNEILICEGKSLKLSDNVRTDWSDFWDEVREFNHAEDPIAKLAASQSVQEIYHQPFMVDVAHSWATIARSEAESAWKHTMTWQAHYTNNEALRLRVESNFTLGQQSGVGPI